MVGKNEASNGHIRTVDKGAVIFREQEQSREMYIVLQGLVEISTIDNQGQKKRLAQVSQGGFFGEMSLLIDGHRHGATAIAESDTVLMAVNKNNFEAIIAQNPQMAFRIMKGLVSRYNSDDSVASTTEQPGGEKDVETAAAAAEPVPETAEQLEESAPPAQESFAETGASLMDAWDVDESGDIVVELSEALQNQYFFNKKVTCPVCGHKFETLVVRDSRLKQKERTDELRVLFQDIEPILYNIWVCPECYYAMKNKEFEKLHEIQKKNLENQINQRKEKYHLTFGGRRTYGFSVMAYKIAVECCESLGKNKVEERVASYWMNVAWLYDDLKEPEKAREARQQALNRYKNAYMVASGTSEKNDQKLEYLIGKLSFGLDNLKDAREYMFKAASKRDGHQMLKDMARDLLDQLK